MSDSTGKTPWKNGYWASADEPGFIYIVDGENMDMKNMIALDYPDVQSRFSLTLKHGHFGPPRKEVAEATGADRNNIEMEMLKIKFPGVLNESGTNITLWSMHNKLDTIKWLSLEEVKKARENRDDFDAPSCPHIVPKPGKPGKIYWFSGPPGAGKSTTCQLLARKNGYIYYEADGTMNLLNPFVPEDADNPSISQMKRKSLKGVPKEDAKIILDTTKELRENVMKGDLGKFDKTIQPLLKIVCREIAKQKKRLGGDFAVAHAVVSRQSRDLCKQLLGEGNVIFLVMNLTKNCQKKRLMERHGDDGTGGVAQHLNKLYDLYEPAGEEEEGSYNLTITEDMTPDDVLKNALETIAKMQDPSGTSMGEGNMSDPSSKTT